MPPTSPASCFASRPRHRDDDCDARPLEAPPTTGPFARRRRIGHHAAVSSRRPIRYRTSASRRAHPRIGRYPYPIHLRARPRKQGGSRVIPILLTLGLAFVVFIGGTVGVLGVTAVGAVTALSEDLPDPAALGE